MKRLLLIPCFMIHMADTLLFANPSLSDSSSQRPSGKNGAEELQAQLKAIQENLNNGKTNLKTSSKNLETIEGEMEALKKLEAEHIQLKSDIEEQIRTTPPNEKGKARQTFLFKASKLEAEVQKQLLEIRSRFAPLQAEKNSWNERKARYEAMISDLSQKELLLNEKLSAGNEPTVKAGNSSVSR